MLAWPGVESEAEGPWRGVVVMAAPRCHYPEELEVFSKTQRSTGEALLRRMDYDVGSPATRQERTTSAIAAMLLASSSPRDAGSIRGWLMALSLSEPPDG